MKNFKNILIVFGCLAFGLIAVDMIFHYVAFQGLITLSNLLFSLFLASFFTYIALLFKTKGKKRTIFIVVLLFGIYGFVQLEFKNFLDNYYSVAAVSDGATRVQEYVLYFLKDAKPAYYLCLLPSLVLTIALHFIQFEESTPSIKKRILIIALTGVLVLASIFTMNPETFDVYRKANNTEFLLNRIGLSHFLFRDVTSLFYKAEEEVEVIEIEEEVIVVEEEDVRAISDSRWHVDMQNEDNEKLLNIDLYLQSKNIDQMNDYTGLFEGKNFIYILVESMDYMAFDEELTPTLYKILTEGYNFENHYTPKYSCTTGESEFIAMTSLVPYNNVCTPNYVTNNAYPQALSYLFKNAGYDTYSFHNWTDQFYNRREEHESWGIDIYRDVDDLEIDYVWGWQSDYELMVRSYKHFKDSDQFFSFIITSTMHWPYDEGSYYGNEYLSEIDAVHPEFPLEVKRYLSKSMEFDRGMEYLLDALEEDGKLDDTVICIFSDHHPFKFSASTIENHSFLRDRTFKYGNDLTPFVIYNAATKGEVVSNVMSTFDQVPTIANLFDLNYDPRLYMGSDVFLDDCFVIYPNGDWIINEGIYSMSNGHFTPFKEETNIDQNKIDNTRAKVSNAFTVSRAIMDYDYFKDRFYLGNPEEVE